MEEKTLLKTMLKEDSKKNNINEIHFFNGERITGYTNETVYIEKISDQGGFATVHKLFDEKENKYYAMKVPRERFQKNVEYIKILEKEASTLVSIDIHSTIIKPISLINYKNRKMLLTEYINGKTLDEFINKESNFGSINSSLSLKNIIDIFIKITKGLDHLLNNDILHLDVKPSNIIIDENTDVKILDFGMSKINKKFELSEDNSEKFIGTLPYMSPEHFKGIQYCDNRSDIYSLGIIMYELVFKKRLFSVSISNDYTQDYLDLHNNFVFNFSNLYNLKIQEIIKKCININSFERYHNYQDLLKDLFELYYELSGYNYNEAIESSENEIDNLLSKANVYINLLNHKEAISIINKILEKDSDNYRAIELLGTAYYGIQNYRKAKIIIKEILNREEVEWGLINLYGCILYNIGEKKESLDYFIKSYEMNEFSDIATVLVGNIGHVALELDDFETAKEFIEKGKMIDPEYTQNIENEMVYLFKNQNNEKIKEFLDPKLNTDWNGEVHRIYSKYYDRNGEEDKAIEILEKFIQNNDKCEYVWNDLGNLYSGKSNYIKTKECFYNALNLKPTDEILFSNYLFSLINTGEYDLAIFEGEKKISTSTYYFYVLYYIFQAYYYLGRFNKAYEYYIKFVLESPRKGNIMFDDGIEMITFLEGRKITQKLESEVEKGLEDSVILYYIGSQYQQKNQYDIAMKYFDLALKKQSNFDDRWAFITEMINSYFYSKNYKNIMEFIDGLPVKDKESNENHYLNAKSFIEIEKNEMILTNFDSKYLRLLFNEGKYKILLNTARYLIHEEVDESKYKYLENIFGYACFLLEEYSVADFYIKSLDLDLLISLLNNEKEEDFIVLCYHLFEIEKFPGSISFDWLEYLEEIVEFKRHDYIDNDPKYSLSTIFRLLNVEKKVEFYLNIIKRRKKNAIMHAPEFKDNTIEFYLIKSYIEMENYDKAFELLDNSEVINRVVNDIYVDRNYKDLFIIEEFLIKYRKLTKQTFYIFYYAYVFTGNNKKINFYKEKIEFDKLDYFDLRDFKDYFTKGINNIDTINVINLYLKYEERNKNNKYFYIDLARLYSFMFQPQNVKKHLKKVLELSKEMDNYILVNYLLCKNDESEYRDLIKWITENEEELDVVEFFANNLNTIIQYKKAVYSFLNRLKQKENYIDIIRFFDIWKEKNKINSEIVKIVGESYKNRNQEDKSIELYLESLNKLKSGRNDIALRIVEIYFSLNQFQNLADFGDMYLMNNTVFNSDIYNVTAIGLNSMGRYNKAIYYYKEALKRSPNNQIIFANLLNVYFNTSNFDDIIDESEIFLETNNGYWRIYNFLGIAYNRKDRDEEAIKYYKKAYLENEKDHVIVTNLMFTYQKINRYKEIYELGIDWIEKYGQNNKIEKYILNAEKYL